MHITMKKTWGSGAVLALAVVGAAHAVPVTSIDPAFTGNGRWYQSDTRAGSTATVVDLTGTGGNLENNQPLGPGAGKFDVGSSGSTKAEISVLDNYGRVSDALSSMKLHYSYYKAPSAGNAETAPSIKLTFYSASFVGDGYMTLVYEPYWNQAAGPGTSNPPPLGAWTAVDIDYTTGLFWSNGGFGAANSFGGPPLKTLGDWVASLDPGFGAADIVALTLGIGSGTPNQVGYFDDVRISDVGYSAAYDFGPAAQATVPEPGSLALVALALGGLTLVPRRRTR